MSEIQIPNKRRYGDIHFRLSVTDNGVPISWDSTEIKRLFMYSEKQRGFGGKCSFRVDTDPHYLNVTFAAYNQQFLGIHRVVVQLEVYGQVATYDARVCNIVASTSNEPVIYDDVIDVPIEVSEVDTTVLHEILEACRLATVEATGAAERADGVYERMSGGNKNEVLTKLSNNPLDIGWKPPQGGGNTHPYLSLARLRPYLYKVTFDILPEDNGGDGPVGGGCSSYVDAGKLYRNLDFNYDEAASFIIRTRDFEGMSFVTGLNDGEMDDELIAQLPYRVVDGRNNNGIMVSTHVLFNDWNWTGTGERSISLTRLPFLVLSRVKSMATIAADLAGVLGNLYASEALQATGYLLQVLVTDGTTTYAILPPTSAGQPYVLQDITANPKLANFRWVSRGTVSRADADLQTRPTGVERWNMMPCPLEDLRFTAAYEDSDRLSEFIGIDGTTKASSDAELLAIYQRARAEYLDRRRDGKTWQTMHSVVYGDRMEHLYIQEDWSDDIVASGTSKEYVDGELARVEAKIPDISGLATLTQLHEVADSIPAKVSDLTNDSGFQTASQVAVAVSAETSRATDEEARIEALSNKVVLNGMTASEDGSTVKLSLAKINIKTGATSSVDVPLPVVDANGAGILNPQTYQTIISNQTLINAIIGASVAVSGLAAEPTQAQVTTAWLTASGEDELVNGARLFDVTNTKVWTYYTNTELWYPVEAEGSVEVAQWTNSALGTVKGVTDNTSHTNDGKLTAETDGTGSVLGWDRLVARVQTIENNEAVWNGKYDKPSTGIPSTDMTTEVQTTLGKVTVLESNVDNLQTTVGGHTTSITSLQTSVTANTTAIASLQSEIDSFIGAQTNFVGIVASTSALLTVTEPSWGLVGTDLDALNAYVWNGTSWAMFGTKTYDFTDYSEAPKIDESFNESDLDITDEEGQVLVRFENGHIRTKNFNSADLGEIKELEFNNLIYARAAQKYFGSPISALNNLHQYPTIVHITDIHGDWLRVKRAATVARMLGAELVSTGDIVMYNSADENIGYFDALEGVGSYIHCVGNHDVWDYTDAQAHDRWITPFADLGWNVPDGNDVVWFYKDDTERKIRYISVDQFISHGAGQHYVRKWGQSQINFIISALENIPADYGVIILMHSPELAPVKDSDNDKFYQSYILPDSCPITIQPLRAIVDAFIGKTTLNTTLTSPQETLSLVADFTNVASNEFICYLTGHYHADAISYVAGSNNRQLLLNETCTNAWVNKTTSGTPGTSYPYFTEASDLPRAEEGSIQDAFNVYVIDRESNCVRVVRIGSDCNKEFVKRDFMSINYK